ncbi:tetratricopeptide repeat protein [Cytophagaceae bacterium 50C-KIRBA]|uniref:Tetratricopeptide repeat protein n=1 Tax=Aquirufa beregesia TaxID=2516556 RepID=A0ABX0EWC6_9BACT|nr:tetratricopeptide repeat protein [Aquirufa beregesia]NGZ44875.1 tetratricopeptide repeat protein [Aquirufa beregesia]
MAKKETKETIEIIESPEALQQELTKVSGFFEKNKTSVLGLGAIIVALVVGTLGYKWYTQTQDEEGEKKLFKAVYAFESDSLSKATKELNKISDEFGGNTQNLADLYQGIALLKQGKFNQSIEKLKNFSSGDLLVQARAYSLIGDAYVEKKSFGEAIDYYKKAADYKPNKFFTPTYLLKLATAYEANKQGKEALATYTDITEKFPESAEAVPAKKYKAQLESSISE